MKSKKRLFVPSERIEKDKAEYARTGTPPDSELLFTVLSEEDGVLMKTSTYYGGYAIGFGDKMDMGTYSYHYEPASEDEKTKFFTKSE